MIFSVEWGRTYAWDYGAWLLTALFRLQAPRVCLWSACVTSRNHSRLLQSLPPYATELPQDCQRSEVPGAVHYDSAYFRERWESNQWLLVYPTPEGEVTAAASGLFPKEDLDSLAANPGAAGARLMEKLEQHLCRPLPERYTLDWYTFLHSDHGDSGAAWLTLAAGQFIDGVRAADQSCNFHFDREGELVGIYCRLLVQDNAALPATDWPDEADVIRVAEAAYLADLRNLPGPGQKVESIERAYRGATPTLIARHAGCGETEVNARTLEAYYSCGHGWPERPHYGVAEGKGVVQLHDLPPYFEDGVFVVDASGGYLLSGSASLPIPTG